MSHLTAHHSQRWIRKGLEKGTLDDIMKRQLKSTENKKTNQLHLSLIYRTWNRQCDWFIHFSSCRRSVCKCKKWCAVWGAQTTRPLLTCHFVTPLPLPRQMLVEKPSGFSTFSKRWWFNETPWHSAVQTQFSHRACSTGGMPALKGGGTLAQWPPHVGSNLNKSNLQFRTGKILSAGNLQ